MTTQQAPNVRQLHPVEPGWTPAETHDRLTLPETPSAGPVQKLADVERQPIEWLWPGYLAAGKVHVFDGDPGVGKSTLTLDLAARISTGTEWPDGQPGCPPAGVALLAAEDGLADTIRPRLDAAGADLQRIWAVTGTDDDHDQLPRLPGDIDYLAHVIMERSIGLIVIDPLMSFLSDRIDPHKDAGVRRALTPLTKAAEATGCAVILVRHLNKSGDGPALYRGGGSIGIIGAARLGFAIAQDPDDRNRVIMAATKSNIGPKQPSLVYHLENSDYDCSRVVWDGTTDRTADDLIAPPPAARETNQGRAAAWLTEYLTAHDGEALRADVMEAAIAAGHVARNVERAFTTGPFISSSIDRHALWQLVTVRADGERGGTGERGERGGTGESRGRGEGENDHA